MNDALDRARGLIAQHRDREAIPLLLAALEAHPSGSLAIELAECMARLGQRAEATRMLELGVALDPANALVRSALGIAYKHQGRLVDALHAQRTAVELAPHNAAIHANLCSLLLESKQPTQALEAAERALALSPQHVDLEFNRATCLLALERYAEARVALESVVARAPTHERAWLNLGTARHELADELGAEAAFRQLVTIAPAHAEAHFNLALRLLAQGRWREGWAEYEWRWSVPSIPLRRPEGVRWQGQALTASDTVLITAEQGLGDTLQFLRYLPLLRERVRAQLAFECPAALAPLLRLTRLPVDHLVEAGQPLPSFTAYTSLLSLPHLLGTEAPPPPFRLIAPVAEVDRFRTAFKGRFTIAIGWQGNPAYPHDARRSVPLAAFETLARIEGVRLVSVQRVHGREQLAAWPASLPLDDLGLTLDRLAPFVDTAAVLAAADLVITSDTALVHLAGSLDRPTWLALASKPDWRWSHLPNELTPWYPHCRVFQQRRENDWPQVFDAMRRYLVDSILN